MWQCIEIYLNNAINDFLLALKLVPDGFITSNMTEKLDDAVFSNNHNVFGDLHSDFDAFFNNGIGLNHNH